MYLAPLPMDGSVLGSSSPERSGSPPSAAIDIRLSRGAPKDTSGTSWGGPARSFGSSTGCKVLVEGGTLVFGEFLTVTVRPVSSLPEVAPSRHLPGGTLDLGRGTGIPPLCRKWSLVRNSPMVILPH
ncbi:hypothetical protein ROHU_032195 [Labeo rohita]|uniref:Uncharacterized protein n=1 Tax=Labeo rohita TaxID=84645 RepID=A0A498LIS3_LABRO|nr:hypothetical protein ROHU_032195 [Labeo rohita]